MLSLNGLRVLNTRPQKQNHTLTQQIESAGGKVIELPTLVIQPNDEIWWDQLPPLTEIKQAIFISANAVEFFFTGLETAHIVWNPHIEITAIGNATASAIVSFGHRVDHIPQVANSEHLVQLANLQQVRKQPILIIKGEGGRPFIADTLHQRGAILSLVNVYKRVLPIALQKKVVQLWQEDQVDVVLFTSQQSIYNLFSLMDEEGKAWIRQKPCIVISNRIGETAVNLGFTSISVSDYEHLLHHLETHAQDFL